MDIGELYGASSDRNLATDRMAIPPSDVPLRFVLSPAVAVVAC